MTPRPPTSTSRSGDSGMALVFVMFMTLVLSVIASSLMFVSTTETLSSYSYKSMAQARYAAESGLHRAANYLLWTYQAPGTPGAAVADPLASYVMTGATVTFGNVPVVLSSEDAIESNYPIAQVRTAFVGATAGTLPMQFGAVTYTARATLLSMRQITDAFSGVPVTLQTWELTGTGRAGGTGAAEVEVTAIIERQEDPVFKYAAFATDPGCDSLRFGGGAFTDSYDSRLYPGTGTPALAASGGNVGTNGNMSGLGSKTTVKGSLSTPRSGVGNCSAGNVTAFTTNGATITGGILELPQQVPYPIPAPLSPLPPVGNVDFKNGCGAGTAAFCSTAGGVVRIDPSLVGGTVTLADVRVQAGTDLHLKSGIYVINSISLAGNSRITVDSPGIVTIKVAGVGSGTPIDFTGGAVTNNSYDPSTLKFIYGGAGDVKMAGGSASAALVYAPNATASLTGGSDFYGAIVARKITDMGGSSIHYDRKLQTDALTAGNPMMGSFSWKTF